jgi:DNA-binding NarL/FixJ family response regulator
MNQILEPELPDVVRSDSTAPKPKLIHVAIVEPDPDVCIKLAGMINETLSCRMVRTCSNAASILNDLPRFTPEVVLFDINLPGADGVESVRRLKALLPKTHIIIFTACAEQSRVLQALVAGASGYLLKRTPPERLLAAIREVCEGGVPMSPEIARCVIQFLRQSPGASCGNVRLTPREREILDQLAKGFRYKEIVDNLGISFGTLHSYISKVYEKLHVHSRTEAVVKYLNL